LHSDLLAVCSNPLQGILANAEALKTLAESLQLLFGGPAVAAGTRVIGAGDYGRLMDIADELNECAMHQVGWTKC
jgi:hypothetical protein